MKNWPLSKKIAPIAALFAVYFPIALYFKHTYVPRPGPSKDTIWLTGPFLPFLAGGKAYLAWLPEFEELADSTEDMQRSPIILYENNRPLGPAHSEHQEIADFGQGRYSHWEGLGLIFSSSDGSDPNRNWKLYSIRREEPQTKHYSTKQYGPFARFGPHGHAFILKMPAHDADADWLDDQERSPLILYEDGKVLGPAHSLHNDIVELGAGRYSHWRGIGVVFSTSDNSDPNVNSFSYTIGPWEQPKK